MAETVNEAVPSLSETWVRTPATFAEGRDKIEKRLARAHGRAELEGSTVEARMLQIEQASRNVEAQRRLQARLRVGPQIADVPPRATTSLGPTC